MTSGPQFITAPGNALLVKLRRLAHDPGAYRRIGMVWLEGEHLCEACVARGFTPSQAVVRESAWADDAQVRRLAQAAPRVAVVADPLFAQLSGLESAARLGFVLDAPAEAQALRTGVATVVLDRLQDAGNVGSILRSAAALGVEQVVALKGTAALWSPKVLRGGMGAHFALNLVEGAALADLGGLKLPLVATSPHGGLALDEAPLPSPCAWVLSHEGQGIAAPVLARCSETRRIPQPGGEESLNVAAAAAICFYESLRQRRHSSA